MLVECRTTEVGFDVGHGQDTPIAVVGLVGNIVCIYESEYMQLGLKIAYYRKLRGLTQEQLAEKIDRTPAFIGHVEAPNINKAVSLDTLFDIAHVLDIPVYKFLMFDET